VKSPSGEELNPLLRWAHFLFDFPTPQQVLWWGVGRADFVMGVCLIIFRRLEKVYPMMNEVEAADKRQHILILQYMATNVLRHAEQQVKSMRRNVELLKQKLLLEAPEGHKIVTDKDQEIFLAECRKRKNKHKS
jgi:hypothetical protein